MAAILLSTLDAAAASTASPAVRPAAETCASVSAPEGVRLEAAPRWVTGGTLPAHCEIRGVASGKVRFVMRLPAEWHGRFLMAGCGGFCGELLPDKEGFSNAINFAVRRGYAAIAHDSGHQAPSWDTAWARDPDALDIWAHRVIPIIVSAGTALARSVYGQPPRYRYFSGCSNGGRLGLIAAQRYPQLFDGVAAGGSIFDLSGTAGLWGSWSTLQLFPDGKPALTAETWKAVHEFVLQSCDAIDGRKDGRIDAPRQCRLDFRDAVTETGDLDSEQATALNRLYGGVRDDGGTVVYPSLEYGSEYFGDLWLGGSAEQPGWGIRASEGYRRLLAASLGETPGPSGLSIRATQALIRRSPIPALTNATDTDLRPFAESGGKLLVYHGLADPLIVPKPVEDYYEAAARRFGGLEALRNHARLFMVPGWGHCWERPSATADDFDPLAALEAWVERDEAPATLRLRSRDGKTEEHVPMR